MDAAGREHRRFEKGSEFFQIPVPEGQAGKLWRLANISGEVSLLTVPPYLARSADELLLPQAVVDGEKP